MISCHWPSFSITEPRKRKNTVRSAMESSAAERLTALRLRLEKARADNLQAVEEEGRKPIPVSTKSKSVDDDALGIRRKNIAKRKRKRGTSRGGAIVDANGSHEDDEDDPVLKSINARAAEIVPESKLSREPQHNSAPMVYGGTSGAVSVEQSDRLVADLKEAEERRARFHRRRAFVEDKADISFINEGNRNFNRILGKHYDKHESVRKIKESLERGTALP